MIDNTRVRSWWGITTLGAVFAVCLSLCACAAGGRSGLPRSPERLGLDAIEFEIPQVESWELPNGLKVYYFHNDELPQINGKLYFPGGSLSEPWGIGGLAGAAGSQMREGSAAGIPPDVLDKRLDGLAASIETSFGGEYGSASFFCLEEDFDEVFPLYVRVVRRPGFDRKRLELWKRLTLEGIRRRRDNPDRMAALAFNALLFGQDTPFTRLSSAESLKKITREKLRAFHRLFVRPDGAILAVSGSLDRARIERAIEQQFGDWQPGAQPRPPLPKVTHKITPGIYVLEREFVQARALIGHRGPPRHTPDIYQMKIYNRVFGHGGFGSLLFREIRTNLGLAYSVYGGLWPGAVAGVFQIDLGTRAPEVVRAVKKSMELTETTRSELPVEEYFANAKSAVERSFVFKFADPGYLVYRAAILDLLGYPADYDQRYLERITAVDREMVRGVGKRRVDPEQFVVVVVGKVSAQAIAEEFRGSYDTYRFQFDTEPRFGAKLE